MTPQPSVIRVIAPMALPDVSDLGDDVRRGLDAIEEAWPDFAALGAAPLQRIVEIVQGRPAHDLPRVPEFEHRLSEEFMRRVRPQLLAPRSPVEDAAARVLRGVDRREIAAKLDDLPALLGDIAEALGLVRAFRAGPAFSDPDDLGRLVQFPAHRELAPRIRNLGNYLTEHLGRSRALAAVVLLNGVCNLHPFADGNGRVARVGFNLVMSEGGPPGYLPLFELAQLSRGGYLIALRLAQYRGEWAPLIDLVRRFISWTLKASRTGDYGHFPRKGSRV